MEFNQLVKKFERKNNTKGLTDLFIESGATVRRYVPLNEKVSGKYLILEKYLDLQAQIDTWNNADIEKDESLVGVAIQNINEDATLQEINLQFTLLNFYCEGVEFTISEDIEKALHDYDVLFSSGLFEYIYAICKTDYENFYKMVTRDMSVALNNAFTGVLRSIFKQLINSIDLSALEGLKNEIKDVVKTEGFKDLKTIVENIK